MSSKKDPKKIEGDGYLDRVKHYFCLTSPSHLFASEEKIKESEEVVSGKNKKKYEKWPEARKAAARCLYEATHDPLTGEVRPVLSRLAAQAPLKTITLGGMLAYYQTAPQIAFWQWLHQSFTSYMDYKNKGPLVSDCDIQLAYSASTAGAVTTALSLHKFMKCSSPFAKRFIPLASVAVGNAINILMLKRRGCKDGVAVQKSNGAPVGTSKVAGCKATTEALLRGMMQLAPALVVAPLVLHNLEQKNKFCKTPQLEAACALGVAGLMLFLLTPFVLARYSEKSSVPTNILEENIQKSAKKEDLLYYYNK